MTDDTEKITVRLPKKFIRALDFLVEIDDMANRSQAIRTAIRDFVYDRVELAGDKLRRLQEAEKAIANLEDLKKDYLQK